MKDHRTIARIIIFTLFTLLFLYAMYDEANAQITEPIVGSWKFELNNKIDYNAMIDTLEVHGVSRDNVYQHAIYYASLAAIIISRCESSTIFFSPFENQVMFETMRYHDPTQIDVQWGRWIKISDGRYLVKFKNRIEYYRLNTITGEFYFERSPYQLSFVSSMLHNNLKMVKKGD